MAVAAAAVSLTLTAADKGKKDDDGKSDKTITAKVWYKDGTVYEGPLLKHWRTRRQGYLNSGHNSHTAPADGAGKNPRILLDFIDSYLDSASK